MATDRRRFNGPETSRSIRRVQQAVTRHVDDGGDYTTSIVYPVLKTGLVPQADGSAYIETGRTRIVCAVYGPHPTRRDAAYSAKARLNVEVKMTPFAFPGRRRTPGKDTESPFLASQISQALLPSLRLDLLPKSQIDLFVTLLESDGPPEDGSAAITAASVALAQAGVEMFGLVIGTCAACCSTSATTMTTTTTLSASTPISDGHPNGSAETSTVILDPTHEESRKSTGILTLACMPALSSITSSVFSGSASRTSIKEALKQSRDLAAQIHLVAVDALLPPTASTTTDTGS